MGQNVKNKIFSVKCCLLAFNIVALDPAVSLELFASGAHVTSYHAYHTYPGLSTVSSTSELYFEKDARFCRDVLMFLPSI